MKLSCLFLIFLGSGWASLSQNLVLNGSFETIEKCPDNLQQFEKNVRHWTNPNDGSTDLFAGCATFKDVQTGGNYQGNQEPKEGLNYAGCYFYGVNDYREYIQGKLSEPLIIGDPYRVQFYVSLGDHSDMAVADIDILLTDTAVNKYDSRNIRLEKVTSSKIQSQLITLTDQIVKDKENWVLLEQEFIATVASSHFIIGNFNSNRNTNKKNQKFITRIRKAYYYIDDVSVIPLKPIVIPEPKALNTQNLKIAPCELNKKYKFENLQFDFDRWDIQQQSMEELHELADYLLSNEQIYILIEGHTDEKGSTDYNEVLALRRVQEVKKFFIKQNIAENRIQIKSYGETMPLRTDGSKQADQQNRRVEFTLSKR